ncbi:hypothetical protein GH714_016928 [Hevea brasiliensis]|uniref:Pentatricopeptide repeat-containing protein n=1 Tax=Hevea brasiliensis TaxID=3981 RepID=A0A6A6LPI1_HEVBR|nr:hypothetical protein GH714_016928 [Hevea brasiliensis]
MGSGEKCIKGYYEKAETLLEELMEKGKVTTPNSWAIVASGYVEKGEVEKAFECMKAAFSLHVKNKGWKPNPRVITDILSWLGDEGSAEDVEAFVACLRVIIPMNRQMYHASLKANIRMAKIFVDFWTA